MFEFKQGDYIVWNKLSGWQKNYLTKTLPFCGSSESNILDLDNKDADGLLFQKDWFRHDNSFGSCWVGGLGCKRVLSFNEIFGNGEEGDTCSTNNHPLWVTFDAEQDWDESCNLIDGKDYKVLEVTHGGDCYTVLDESGSERSYNKRFFDKPVSVNSCKKSPTPCEEDKYGFEELVYVRPNVMSDYVVIDIRKLSDEQLKFIKESFYIDEDEDFNTNQYEFINLEVATDKWFVYSRDYDDTEVTFNDLFKEVQ